MSGPPRRGRPYGPGAAPRTGAAVTDPPPRVEGRAPRLSWVTWLLAQGVLGVCLLPYLSPLPIPGVDVQPVAFAAASLALLYLAAMGYRVGRLNGAEAMLLGAALLSAVYLDPTSEAFRMSDLRKTSAPLVGLMVYLSVRHLRPAMSPWTLLGVVWAMTAGWVLQWRAPAAYAALSGALLSRVSGLANNRGLNGLCPEPSFLAYTCILCILLSVSFRASPQRWPRWAHAMTVLLCLAGIAASKAAMGVALGGLVLCAALVERRRWGVLLLLGLGGLSALVIAPQLGSQRSRAGQFVSSILSNPAAVLDDESFGERLDSLLVGASAVAAHPLGTGTLYPREPLYGALPAYAELRREVFPERVIRVLDGYPNEKRMNDVSITLYRMGAWGALLFALLLHAFGRGPGALPLRALAGIGIAMSLPVSLPPLYLMMAWTRTPDPPRRRRKRPARSSPIPLGQGPIGRA